MTNLPQHQHTRPFCKAKHSVSHMTTQVIACSSVIHLWQQNRTELLCMLAHLLSIRKQSARPTDQYLTSVQWFNSTHLIQVRQYCCSPEATISKLWHWATVYFLLQICHRELYPGASLIWLNRVHNGWTDRVINNWGGNKTNEVTHTHKNENTQLTLTCTHPL